MLTEDLKKQIAALARLTAHEQPLPDEELPEITPEAFEFALAEVKTHHEMISLLDGCVVCTKEGCGFKGPLPADFDWDKV